MQKWLKILSNISNKTLSHLPSERFQGVIVGVAEARRLGEDCQAVVCIEGAGPTLPLIVKQGITLSPMLVSNCYFQDFFVGDPA